MKKKKKQVTFERKEPTKRPLVNDTVGTARKFLDDILASMKGVGIFSAMGVSPNTSYLLSGVHGTGKTFSLNALNNEMNKGAVGVDIWDMYQKLADVEDRKPTDRQRDDKELIRHTNNIYQQLFKMNMFEYRIGDHGTAYINIGAKILQSFFNIGIAKAEEKTTVLVFDEADQIMSKRGGSSSHKEDDKLISTLMKNLQEIQDKPNLFTVFLTNFPQSMDSAAIRAGRIDKRYTFELPNKEERKQLITSIIRQRNEVAGYMVVRNFNVLKLAEKTDGFSNADIDQVIKEALRKRAREIVRKRTDKLIPAAYVTQVRLEESIEKHRTRFKFKQKNIGFK
jgi:SpoVK/Ycf46/Vps4 family AAA+-type ATPase